MADLTGQSIGRYQILSRLGEGGMATVYKARDTRLDRDVALKLIRVDQFAPAMMDHVLARFEREAKSLARLSHNSIVRVYDYGEHNGAPYLVLEYCEGGDLKQRLRGQPMDWQEAIALILPVARALRFSHQQGVIHRDVKPSNIMFNNLGEPMLSDFGIAKMLETNDAATLTGTGVGIGTPGYMAPEQWTGETSPQSDQYGLGVVLYEMLTGRKPYESDTPAGILIKQTSQPLPLPSKYVPTLPPEVEIALLKSLDRNPAERHADMTAFIKAFEGLLQQTPVVETKPATASEPKAPVDPYKTLDVVVPVVVETPRTITPADWETTATPLPDKKPINWKMIAIGGAALVVLAGVVWGGMQLAKGFPAAPEPSATPARATNMIQTRQPSQKPTHTPTATQADTPTATALPVQTTLGIGSTLTREKDGMAMIYVPEGPFEMGSKSGENDESPVHTVNLDAFWIDQTEVTNGMYKKCVEAGKCDPPVSVISYTRGNYYGNTQYDDFPVIYVDWNQAKAYCSWAGADLPTEAQWEKAARGTDGRKYPWGGGSPTSNLVNFNNSVGDTTKVGGYSDSASPYDAYNMAGNVWEWVNDWYDAYPGNSTSSSGYGTTYRVLRGGSWSNDENLLRSSYRNKSSPAYTGYGVGFRCASSVPPAAAPAASRPQATPTPVANTLPEEIIDEKGVTMRLVPSGPFIMGSDSGEDDEKPVHEVSLDAFYMDTYEVTNAHYIACVENGVCTAPNNSTYRVSSISNFPVSNVTWSKAKTYCEWRGARLPTEAEWEKAARGTDGRSYPWGEGIDCTKAHYCQDSAVEVGTYEIDISPYGMYDMAGNVWEWVNDRYDPDYYSYSPSVNPQGPDTGESRGLRGGGWGILADYLRTSVRGGRDPESALNSIGFRCARDSNP